MASKTVYPNTFTQTKGKKLVEFGNVKNLKNINSSYSQSVEELQGKKSTPNQPSKLTLSNFKCKIPTGSVVTKVTVCYCQQKIPKEQNKYPNIGAPSIDVVHNGKSIVKVPEAVKAKNKQKSYHKGKAPTKNQKVESITFNVKASLAKVNSSEFGVSIEYPSNSNSYKGYMRLYYVYLKITYAPSNFNVGVAKVGGGYNKSDYVVKVSISNAKKTGYNPSVTITSPPGFSFKLWKGEGKLKRINTSTFVWTPKMSKNKKSSHVNLRFSVNVSYPSGQDFYEGVFRAVESLNGHIGMHTAHITDKPKSQTDTKKDKYHDDETDTSGTVDTDIETITPEDADYTVPVNINGESITLAWANPQDILDYIGEHWGQVMVRFRITSEDYISYDLDFVSGTVYGEEWTDWVDLARYMFINLELKGNYETLTNISYLMEMRYVKYENEEFITYFKQGFAGGGIFDFVITEEQKTALGIPFFTVFELSDEEMDRLGDGHNYIVQSFIRENTSEGYVRDWWKNFRIVVFNNRIESNITTVTEIDEDGNPKIMEYDNTDYEGLTLEEMFYNALYIGNPPSAVNTFENTDCEFVCDKNYPLKIFVVGDYFGSSSIASIDFTDLCIVEADLYNDYEEPGVYPIHIDDLIVNDGSTAEMDIAEHEESAPIIFSNPPLEDGFGSDENMVIRGLGVQFTVEKSDEMVVYCTLKSATGATGDRSIVLNDKDTEIDSGDIVTIGGVGDLWGFNTADITDLEDWEIHLTVNNLIRETNSTINFGDVQFIVYTEDIDDQLIKIMVDGEDLSYYGIFVENVKIPAGLNTDVDYLNVNGTDLNDPFIQNIREKTIEIEFNIDSCDLPTSTDMLRQLTQLLVNERDEYNRPILKTVSFSHYPDLEWQYIFEEAFEADAEISDYKAKVKLVVPSGTAYKKEDTVTNTIGYVQGLTAVKPVLIVKPYDENIEITETISNQTFNMGFVGDWTDNVIEIDCENRRVNLKENEDSEDPEDMIDISRYVDINSDWFRLLGAFEFETTNCTLYTVTYTERW